MKKRIELTITELQWIESALMEQMERVKGSMRTVKEGTQVWQLMKLRFGNLSDLFKRIDKKIGE